MRWELLRAADLTLRRLWSWSWLWVESYGERWTVVPSAKIDVWLPSGSKYLMVWSGNKISLFPPGCRLSVTDGDILLRPWAELMLSLDVNPVWLGTEQAAYSLTCDIIWHHVTSCLTNLLVGEVKDFQTSWVGGVCYLGGGVVIHL